MRLFKTKNALLLEEDERFYFLKEDWDSLVNRKDLFGYLSNLSSKLDNGQLRKDVLHMLEKELLPPVGGQEVWAAGVTYQRSREARMEESDISGGADFYDKVYEAERPELFFKSLPHRLAGHGQEVYIRKD